MKLSKTFYICIFALLFDEIFLFIYSMLCGSHNSSILVVNFHPHLIIKSQKNLSRIVQKNQQAQFRDF